jgi:hypothetical protein
MGSGTVGHRQGVAKLLRKKFGERCLTVFEDVPHPAFDEKRISERAERTKSNFILDYIAHQRTSECVAIVRDKFVAMVPPLERTFLLDIGKMMVPFELGDGSSPVASPGKPSQRAKRRVDNRSGPGKVMQRDSIFIWRRRRRHQLETIHLCSGFGRHEPRKVVRVGKEREDLGNWKWNPVGELKVVRHGRAV